MTKKLILLFALMAFLTVSALATPIPLNTGNTSPANAGDATVLAWLNGLITAYNTANSTSLAAAVSAGSFKVNSGDTPPSGYPSFGAGTLSITLPADQFAYLVLHWGGPGGGTWEAFDLTTIPEVTDVFNAPGQNGLSSYAFFNPTTTPEPASLLLLGSGLAGLALRRRKK